MAIGRKQTAWEMKRVKRRCLKIRNKFIRSEKFFIARRFLQVLEFAEELANGSIPAYGSDAFDRFDSRIVNGFPTPIGLLYQKGLIHGGKQGSVIGAIPESD